MKYLNEQQKQAVESTQGRVLVLAGAGSGKTSVIISRIAYLITQRNVLPSQILGLTFTNKAAAEMRQRLAKSIGKERAEEVTLCTFHSYCFHLLKREIHHLGYTNQFSIYDEKDIKRVLNSLIRQESKENDHFPGLDDLFMMIKGEKEIEGITPMVFSKIHQDLFSLLKSYNAVDFDGLIELTLNLFDSYPEILKKEQLSYRFIMIDEYQDTNKQQYQLAQLLSADHKNLCVVGDDDQSIYSWRGAEIKNILEFPYHAMIKLEQNYRSTPTILKAANHVIGHNKGRYDKTLWSRGHQGNPIHLFHAPTEEDEADAVIMRIIDLKAKTGMNWSDMAILYRSNTLSRPFEAKLLQAVWQKGVDWVRGIPYQVVQGTEFYERAEVKDMVAYLKVITNPKDQEALLRIINYPRRGISAKTLETLTAFNRKQSISLWEVLLGVQKEQYQLDLTTQAKEGIQRFVLLIKEARRRFEIDSFNDAYRWFIDEIHYKEMIEAEVKSDKAQAFRWENVILVGEMLSTFEEENPDRTLYDFLSETMLDGDKYQRKKQGNFGDRIQLMTFHSAKGLEFDACFLVGLEDQLIPHEKNQMAEKLEEERRLFYVGMTRAKKYLTLSMCRSRKKHGKPSPSNPSRFLFEIPKEVIKVGAWNFPEPFINYDHG